MKKELWKPIVVLTLICLIITGALAVTNHMTGPIIEAAAAAREEAARREVLPGADSFAQMELQGLPKTVIGAWQAKNGAGLVLKLKVSGYKGPIELLCGVDADGRIAGTKTLAQSETAGVGAKIAEQPFRTQFIGQDAALEGVEVISGATISSKAYLAAIHDAFTALTSIGEGG